MEVEGMGLSLSLGGCYSSRVPKDEPDQEEEEAPTCDRFRKKLRLSKEQSTLLEDSFKLHTTLNPTQKQTLARQLNLKPRQVEVWFQNRRARTKLKQTEIECELLKKCCERLSDENRRLNTEIQQLRSLSSPSCSHKHLDHRTTCAALPLSKLN